MQPASLRSRAAWSVADLQADQGWVVELDVRARRDLTQTVRRAYDPEKALFDYRRADFELGSAWPAIEAVLREVREQRGFALLRGLPRDGMAIEEFQLLTWAIGLHAGVARPQGKASQYISAVRDAGTVYRTGRGRGYSSNAELDFHTDSADIALLTCYNPARSGGMSLVSSSVAAHDAIERDRPDLAALLHEPYYFSRQEEQAPDEAPFYPNPIFDVADGGLFSKWNRNRLQSAQSMPKVPKLTDQQREALSLLDETLRHPALMYRMYLQPGDMQLLNNHVTLHSRTEFTDHDDLAMRRTLFRLWLAPPDWPQLPMSWKPAYRSIESGVVRGGIQGQSYSEDCRRFEALQAAELGMRVETEPDAAAAPIP
jgi:hypothetical protein